MNPWISGLTQKDFYEDVYFEPSFHNNPRAARIYIGQQRTLRFTRLFFSMKSVMVHVVRFRLQIEKILQSRVIGSPMLTSSSFHGQQNSMIG